MKAKNAKQNKTKQIMTVGGAVKIVDAALDVASIDDFDNSYADKMIGDASFGDSYELEIPHEIRETPLKDDDDGRKKTTKLKRTASLGRISDETDDDDEDGDEDGQEQKEQVAAKRRGSDPGPELLKMKENSGISKKSRKNKKKSLSSKSGEKADFIASLETAMKGSSKKDKKSKKNNNKEATSYVYDDDDAHSVISQLTQNSEISENAVSRRSSASSKSGLKRSAAPRRSTKKERKEMKTKQTDIDQHYCADDSAVSSRRRTKAGKSLFGSDDASGKTRNTLEKKRRARKAEEDAKIPRCGDSTGDSKAKQSQRHELPATSSSVEVTTSNDLSVKENKEEGASAFGKFFASSGSKWDDLNASFRIGQAQVSQLASSLWKTESTTPEAKDAPTKASRRRSSLAPVVDAKAVDARLAAIEDMERLLAEERAQMEKEKEAIAFERESLEMQLNEEIHKNESLQQIVDQEGYHQTSKKDDDETKNILNNTVKQLSIENATLKATLEGEKREGQNVLDDLKDQIVDLKLKIEETEAAEATKKTDDDSARVEKMSMAKMHGELLQASSKIAEKESLLDRLKRKSAELTKEVEAYREGRGTETLEKEINDMKKRRADRDAAIRMERAEMLMKIAKKDETIAFLIEEIGNTKKQQTPKQGVGFGLSSFLKATG